MAHVGNISEVTEELSQNLAWNWPARQKSAEARLEAALRVPPMINNDIKREFHSLSTVARVNRTRKILGVMQPKSTIQGLGPAEQLAVLIDGIALAESASSAHRPMVAGLARAASAIDANSHDSQSAAIAAAALVVKSQRIIPYTVSIIPFEYDEDRAQVAYFNGRDEEQLRGKPNFDNAADVAEASRLLQLATAAVSRKPPPRSRRHEEEPTLALVTPASRVREM